jgi:hypothetical protein
MVRLTMGVIVALMMFFPASVPEMRADSSSEHYDECAVRCSSLAGADRYKCTKLCVSAKRKNDPGSRDDTKKKMDECEELCEGNKGVERIKCIRLCLDRKKEARAKEKVIIKEKESPCESRCGLLTGTMKDKCMLKCEKDIKFESGYRPRDSKK